MKKYILLLAIMVLGMVIGWLCRSAVDRGNEVAMQTDTIVYRDTIREILPIEKKVFKTDTMFILVRDTVLVNDTLYIQVRRERKVYSSEDYYAEVSGYKPNLDYIEVYPKTVQITEKIHPKEKKNSLSLGMETCYSDRLTTPIYLEYERMLHKNVGVFGKIEYDLPSGQYGVGIGLELQIGW